MLDARVIRLRSKFRVAKSFDTIGARSSTVVSGSALNGALPAGMPLRGGASFRARPNDVSIGNADTGDAE